MPESPKDLCANCKHERRVHIGENESVMTACEECYCGEFKEQQDESPKCPKCGHSVNVHYDDGCYHSKDGKKHHIDCDCGLSNHDCWIYAYSKQKSRADRAEAELAEARQYDVRSGNKPQITKVKDYYKKHDLWVVRGKDLGALKRKKDDLRSRISAAEKKLREGVIDTAAWKKPYPKEWGTIEEIPTKDLESVLKALSGARREGKGGK